MSKKNRRWLSDRAVTTMLLHREADGCRWCMSKHNKG
jgi:hypothetical protein